MLIVCTSVYNHSCKLQVIKTDDEVSLVGVIYSLSDNGAPIARWRFRPKCEPGGWKNFGILYIHSGILTCILLDPTRLRKRARNIYKSVGACDVNPFLMKVAVLMGQISLKQRNAYGFLTTHQSIKSERE